MRAQQSTHLVVSVADVEEQRVLEVMIVRVIIVKSPHRNVIGVHKAVKLVDTVLYAVMGDVNPSLCSQAVVVYRGHTADQSRSPRCACCKSNHKV